MAEPEKRVYTQEEVNAILSRAIERQQPEGALTLDEVVAAAREAGIAPDAVEAAARELEEDHASRAVERRGKDSRTRAWLAHFVTYLSVMAFLVVLNVMTGGPWWIQWPALGWGFGLMIHALTVVFTDKEKLQRRQRKRARREEQKRAREEVVRTRHEKRERKRAVETGARELGQAVERAAATLLAATAKKIHEEVDRAEGKPGEPPRPRVKGEEPRPRIDARGEDEDELDDEPIEPAKAKRRG